MEISARVAPAFETGPVSWKDCRRSVKLYFVRSFHRSRSGSPARRMLIANGQFCLIVSGDSFLEIPNGGEKDVTCVLKRQS